MRFFFFPSFLSGNKKWFESPFLSSPFFIFNPSKRLIPFFFFSPLFLPLYKERIGKEPRFGGVGGGVVVFFFFFS